MVIAFLLAGCGHNDAVYEAYEEAKSAALADPGPAPRSWTADLRVQISAPMLDALVQNALQRQESFTGKVTLPLVELTPTVTANDLKLSASTRCSSCFAVDLDVSGDVVWDAGVLGGDRVSFTAELSFDVEVEPKLDGEVWRVFAKPRDLRSAEVEVDGWSRGVRNIAEQPLKQWLDDEVVSRIEPMEITNFGSEGLPLRGLRLMPQGAALAIDMLTKVPAPGTLGPAPKPPKAGFVVWIHPQSVIGFAQAEAFKAGPQAYDIVAEPRSLTVQGNDFTLGLRLWRIGGAGWWRDYSAAGRLGVNGRRIELAANAVTETGKSEGAEVADPLVVLGESLILSEMERAMQLSFPRAQLGGASKPVAAARVKTLRGEGGALRIGGALELRGPRGLPGSGRKRKGLKR